MLHISINIKVSDDGKLKLECEIKKSTDIFSQIVRITTEHI